MYYIFSDINECVNVTCEDHGTCEDIVNGFICTCFDGYTGATCQTGNCTE